MVFVRTPDERFAAIPDFPYEPVYVEVDGLRMAYVDVGPATGSVVLLLHGEPTWGFLYRRMIPPLVEAGFRCLVPDLIGFGRSDKPVDRSIYTYARHVAWMKEFLDAIELPSATLFAQDWGGLIGLRVAAEEPDRFHRIAIGNTGLPVGKSIGDGFDGWLHASQTMDFMDAGRMLQRATQARELTEGEMDAYRAPFPDETYMAGARQFPTLVPITPDHGGVAENLAAWEVLDRWDKPFLTLWCPGDPVLGRLHHEFIERVPGAADQPHQEFEPGGHFLQDDRGEDVAAALIDWMT
ncbi:MAG: haloalkane dehalogenase [Acidimicrobiia bacterium]|nr:haloalkane dehalogenase [Acidimicrobiia bacterium]